MPSIKPWVGLFVLIAAMGTAQAATPGKTAITQLGFRDGQRCVLHEDGAVLCVHESPYEGDLDEKASYRPVTIVTRGATQLAVGGFASCAIVAGALDCWSGLPATGTKAKASRNVIASGVTEVAVGEHHACAAARGAALCWGSDNLGQAGHYDTASDRSESRPWPVIAQGVTRVAAGGDVSCAVADGALWCWGDTGLASDPDTAPGDHPPVRVFAQGTTEVAVGSKHACAIVESALWCWGDNSHGQVGIGMSAEHALQSHGLTPRNSPEPFADGAQRCRWQDWSYLACRVEQPVRILASGVSAIFARGDETCALKDGTLMCWGSNAHGQLGIDPAKDVLAPTAAIARDVTFAIPTPERTCAVMMDGTLRCTRPCTANSSCPEHPGFVTGDPTDASGIVARTGVWRGTVGGAKVMVCLERPDTLNDSQYYYLRHRFSIPLAFAGGGTWHETAPQQRADNATPAATWTLHMPEGGTMAGTWSAADGARTVPIELTRVADAGQSMGSGCDGDDNPARRAFNAPRVSMQKLEVHQVDGYRSVSTLRGLVSMTELPDSLPHAAQFNASMRAWFASSVAGYYECAFSSSNGPDYNDTSEAEVLSPTWLVVRHNWSGYCGGAHPSAETDYTTWNLATGKTVSPWDFLKSSHWDYLKETNHCTRAGDCLRRPPRGLSAILTKRFNQDNQEDEDCAGAIEENIDYLQLHPERNGLVFSTTFPHVIQACDEDIALPWKTLAPFLTGKGKAFMREMQAQTSLPATKARTGR